MNLPPLILNRARLEAALASPSIPVPPGLSKEQTIAFLDAVSMAVAAERERCAQVCEAVAEDVAKDRYSGWGHSGHASAIRCGDVIRHGKEAGPVDGLELTVRSSNALRSAGIFALRQLLRKTEGDLLKIPNLGHKSVREIREVLAARGLSLSLPKEAS